MQHARTTTHRARRRAGVALAVAATLLLGACGATDAEQATARTSDRPTTTVAPRDPSPGPTVVPDRTGPPAATPVTAEPEAPAPVPPPTTVAPAPATLEDGRHFGYLVDYELDSTATAASFDLALLLTGDDADRAAQEDGVVGPGEEVENDAYVRNVNPRLRRALFRDDARVTVLDCTNGCTPVPADRTALQRRPTPTPVWLTVDGGVVVAADEVYLP